jgi:putative endopeptidase
MSLRSALATAFASVILSACSSRPAPPAPAAPSSGIDVAGMDRSVNPGDVFFEYVNGGWLKATEIPADKSRYGVFTILGDDTRKRTVAIIQESANAGANVSDEARKIGDYYSSFIDEAAIEAKGIGPLKPQLDSIAGISDRQMLSRMIGSTLRADVDPLNNTNFETENLFGVWIA